MKELDLRELEERIKHHPEYQRQVQEQDRSGYYHGTVTGRFTIGPNIQELKPERKKP